MNAALCAASCLCLSSAAQAQDGARFDLDYAAAASCPDAASFAQRVQDRLGTSASTSVDAPRPRASVRLHAAEAGFVAQLELRRSADHVERREVNGATCAEVANATAFVLALALNNEAADAPAPPNAPTLSAPLPPAAPLRAHPPQTPHAWSFGVGGQIGVRTGLGPSWTGVGAGFVDVRRARPTPFVWWLRVAFLDAEPVHRFDRNGQTDFKWWAGRVELCPVSVRVFGPLALAPCVASHVGVLAARGKPLVGGAQDNASKPWWDAAGSLRLTVQPLPWLALEAQGDLVLPITRYQFAFSNPNSPVYAVPALARSGWLGLTARFP